MASVAGMKGRFRQAALLSLMTGRRVEVDGMTTINVSLKEKTDVSRQCYRIGVWIRKTDVWPYIFANTDLDRAIDSAYTFLNHGDGW